MVGPVAPDDLEGLTHAFLIRDPHRMAASYARKRETVTCDDLGLRLQREFFDRECDRLGHAPPVIDSAYVLAEPEGMLSQLCWALGISWDPAMLHWPAGRHPEDGSGRPTGIAMSRPAPALNRPKLVDPRPLDPRWGRSPTPAWTIICIFPALP